MVKMGWNYFMEESCNKLLHDLIDKKIIKCSDKIEEPVLDKIHKWFEQVVFLWLQRLLQNNV